MFICDDCVERGHQILDQSAGANNPPPSPDDLRDLACSFCSKSAAQVLHLVKADDASLAGGAQICDECLHLSDDIVAGKLAGELENGVSFTLRVTHAPAYVDAQIARVREALERRRIGQIAFPIVDGERDLSATLLAQVKSRVADIADTWERAFTQPRALTLVVLPKPRAHRSSATR